MLRKFLYLFSALLLGAGALSGVQASGATFTDTSTTPLNIFSAPDWTAPDVSIADPGYAVAGTVTLNATASDGDTAIASVAVQRAPHGSSTWTTICTDNGAPYSCSWNTTQVADGDYDLRAVATDVHSNTKTSAKIMTTVINAAGVVLDPVEGPVRASVFLQGRIVNAGSGPSTIRFQFANTGQGNWTDIPGCGPAAGPNRTCTVDTSGITGYFDWRAIGTINGNTYYDYENNVLVDNTAPSISQSVPAGPLAGTVNITATANDAHSGMASVRFEYRRSGVTTWTTCVLDTVAPYSCSLNTAGLTDGSYEFRATSTDVVGNTASNTTTRDIRNSSVDVASIPTTVKDTVGLTASWNGAGTPSVRFQQSASGATGPWTDICIDNSAPYTCSWNTTSLDSQRWWVRALVSVNGVDYEEVQSTIVDNDDPNVTLTVPAAPLYGTISLTATASDADPTPGDESSGMANVTFQYRRVGTPTWTTCGTDGSSPYACSLDTRPLANGNYEFRATGTDNVGNTTTPTPTTRSVDNTPWATLTAPAGGGTYLQGSTIAVSANGYSPTGIDSMTLQYDASTPGTTWVTTSCTDNGAPYTCNWNTLNVPSGTTTLRIAMNRTGGGTTYSSTIAVTIEQLRAFDVQANSVSNQGQPATGDTVTMYYSTTVNLGTIRAGWTGSSQGTTVSFNDRQVGSPLVANADYMSFAGGINLGQVALGLDYVQANRSVGFNANMSAATVPYQGRTVTRVTITLTSQIGSNPWFTDQGTTGGTLRWTPSATVTDTFGQASQTTTAQETGSPADVDL